MLPVVGGPDSLVARTYSNRFFIFIQQLMSQDKGINADYNLLHPPAPNPSIGLKVAL